MSNSNQSSYRQILKSSSLIGGASVINMLMGAVRTKFMAILLGPAGIGLMGTYVTITSTVGTLAGFGIGSSGVRQIALAVGTGDEQRIARTTIALRRSAMLLGFAGMVLLALLSWPVSKLTFNTPEHTWAIALLATTVFFGSVSAGQTALIQGMRRIGDLSRLNVLSAIFSTVVGVPLVFWLGLKAIVPVLLFLSCVTILTSWWYARKIPVAPIRLTWRETWNESRGLLRMGIAFLVSGVSLALVGYLIRVLIIRQLGIDAAGQYQSAFTLAGLYAGFVLQAMGADFYPRLTAVAQDNLHCNRMVNEQTEVALLLAGPGILATMAFAPLVIHLFYSTSFAPAIILLRWFALGLLLRAISWPMGFIVLAKGLGTLFIVMELLANAVYLGLTLLGLHYFSLAGTAMAFVGLYVFYVGLVVVVAWKLTRFCWTRSNIIYGAIILGATLSIFGLSFVLRETLVAIIGSGAVVAFGLYSLKRLSAYLHGTRLEPYLARFAPKWLYSTNDRK